MVKHNFARPDVPLFALLILCGAVVAPPSWAQQFGPPPPPASEPPALAAPAPPPAASIAPVPPVGQAPAATPTPGSIVHRIQGANERIEMLISTSRILTLDQKIPQAQVGNPDILDIVPLSPNQLQISAKKAGVTQVNLWGEDKRVYAIDVIVTNDARELTMVLKAQFPKAALNVTPVGSSVLISGFVDQQEAVPRIVRIAEEYYPKIINNIVVSGVQQVVLRIKVMEVSRTKLRKMGFDWANISSNSVIQSTPSGIISAVKPATSAAAGAAGGAASVVTTGGETFAFSIVNGASAFFGVLEALRNDKLAKVLSEPNLVAISGRPAYFMVGGELAYQTSSISGTSIDFKKYGTQVDFVPIVLGNGRIRLEVRPCVSDIDRANSLPGAPALKTREIDTGVELRAGQTLAIGGLVQQRIEAENRGLPWISEVPYLGVPFRKVTEEINEVELLILVTPDFIEPMDPDQVPPCGPGMQTTSPNDWELYVKGHLEVPTCCPSCQGKGCQTCGSTGQQGGPPPEGMMLQPGPAGQPTRAPRPSPQNPNNPSAHRAASNAEPTFLGPVGYDLAN